jgi:hypothetical protein
VSVDLLLPGKLGSKNADARKRSDRNGEESLRGWQRDRIGYCH